MLHRLVLVMSLLSGCGSMGLSTGDTGVTAIASLGVDPTGDVDFGRVSPAKDKSDLEDVILFAEGLGTLNVVDVYLSNASSGAFTMRNNLPLPMRLHDGEEFPVQVRFLPYTTGSFEGELVVLVDDGTAQGTEVTVPLLGWGCQDPDQTGTCTE